MKIELTDRELMIIIDALWTCRKNPTIANPYEIAKLVEQLNVIKEEKKP